MLPEIPAKLRRIDELTVGEHYSLEAGDRCIFIWEYTRGADYRISPSNQLIKNLKITPTELAANPAREKYKKQAIAHSATALRQLLSRRQVEQQITFVPVPGSKARSHPDYDDRLEKVLVTAFSGWEMDLRPVLDVTNSVTADHLSDTRISADDLLAITRVTDTSPTRPMIVIFDDVLNSGKHFNVARRLLTRAFPAAEIRGLFIARCIGADPFDQ